ncbi:MAG: TfoX/Sxy family protein [Deltaproteobacteria bacterium]
MAFDEKLAGRIRKLLEERNGTEKKMFGGIAFMLSGHMCCGVLDDQLMARVGPDRYESALDEKHVRVMDFTGKPMKGYVYVGPGGCRSDKDLKKWVGRCVEFVSTLPPRKAKK